MTDEYKKLITEILRWWEENHNARYFEEGCRGDYDWEIFGDFLEDEPKFIKMARDLNDATNL